MYHKAPKYGSGHYARPINREPKVGYQEPRADVARPFKPPDYGNGIYDKYKLLYTHLTPEQRRVSVVTSASTNPKLDMAKECGAGTRTSSLAGPPGQRIPARGPGLAWSLSKALATTVRCLCRAMALVSGSLIMQSSMRIAPGSPGYTSRKSGVHPHSPNDNGCGGLVRMR